MCHTPRRKYRSKKTTVHSKSWTIRNYYENYCTFDFPSRYYRDAFPFSQLDKRCSAHHTHKHTCESAEVDREEYNRTEMRGDETCEENPQLCLRSVFNARSLSRGFSLMETSEGRGSRNWECLKMKSFARARARTENSFIKSLPLGVKVFPRRIGEIIRFLLPSFRRFKPKLTFTDPLCERRRCVSSMRFPEEYSPECLTTTIMHVVTSSEPMMLTFSVKGKKNS